ncbi:deoxyhypusine synthase family protein [Candidatus Woesearchaeota archaeon]|nr:deoxyhypusine synthase family protein [Candidatus Woesearchaeota archaeon]
MESVKHIEIKEGMSVKDLVKEMNKCGVIGAGRIGKASEIFAEMLNKKCKIYFGLAGAMVPGGMRNILKDMILDGYIDVLVTTGANLTHDLAEALGFQHIKGESNVNDAELNKKGFDRVFDSYMQNKAYEKMEDLFNEHLSEIENKRLSGSEFLRLLGSWIKDKNSILRVCYEKNIPIYCPALMDSGIGLMLWGLLAKGKKFDILLFDDLKEIMNSVWESKVNGVFYIGGGVPKNFIQQAMQFSPNMAEYGIQITMDRPEWGGSSGAELKEGISWGKMKPKGKFVDVKCDATIALPLIYSYIKGIKRK